MSRLGQTVHVRGATGTLSGARVVAEDWAPVDAGGGTYVQTYVGYPETWDIAGEGYFDDEDEMVVPADGIYLVAAQPNIPTGDLDITSGYLEANITRNGEPVASYALSYQQDVSKGWVDEPELTWAGAASVGDRFAVAYLNQTNVDANVGDYAPHLCILRIA